MVAITNYLDLGLLVANEGGGAATPGSGGWHGVTLAAAWQARTLTSAPGMSTKSRHLITHL